MKEITDDKRSVYFLTLAILRCWLKCWIGSPL